MRAQVNKCNIFWKTMARPTTYLHKLNFDKEKRNELRTALSMFSQNPRWLPYHITDIAHDTLACGASKDYLTI